VSDTLVKGHVMTHFRFDNSYSQLPERFYERIQPTPVQNPKLIQFNQPLANELQISFDEFNHNDLAEVFSGNKTPDGANPIALAYAGHQFGHFVPSLGDGRAILLGEVFDKNQIRHDIQLKGSGPTSFSRRGDGRAALGPMMREYIVSEAMFAMGIPTTRSLALVTTGETVRRDGIKPGAILIRVAKSHIRVGTFEYFAARGDVEALKILLNYCVQRHFPDVADSKNLPIDFLREAVKLQAKLIAQWMSVGFVHGVMNTDNMAISGETIDYGPCAFLDEYNPNAVWSSIDHQGRYAYSNQASIALWNLHNLASCLHPLIDLPDAVNQLKEVLAEFEPTFQAAWLKYMGKKIGFDNSNEADQKLIQELLNIMHSNQADYTLTFKQLANSLEAGSSTTELGPWISTWKSHLKNKGISNEAAVSRMNASNPIYIPRNHKIEFAIQKAEIENDFTEFKSLLNVLKNPYLENTAFETYSLPPKPEEKVHETFCGT
jgi:uncharacterized protein YdiU (UPF0061 family)